MKLKYYNSILKIGLNNWREVYDCNADKWLKAKVHNGRLVYGNSRIPYKKIKSGIDKINFEIKEFCPF